MRCTLRRSAGILQGNPFGKDGRNFFTSLWNKPETRDERVKEYVPEVLEESLAEQRAVLQESTSRDVIVELGHKVLLEIENKSPTPSIAPHLNKLLNEYGAKDIIAQRPLSYLLYPTSSALSAGEQPHELVSNFADNFRALVEEVEQNGCTVQRGSQEDHEVTEVTPTAPEASRDIEATVANDPARDSEGDTAAAADSEVPNDKATVVMAKEDEYEPMDVTLFVRVASGMALANLHCSDLRNAVRCVDAGIAHAVDPQRLGGLLGLKAGLLVRQKKFDDAAAVAKLAIEASSNVQGFLHGAYALRMLRRPDELIALLEEGAEAHPMNTQIADQLEAAKKDAKLSLADGKDSPKSGSASKKLPANDAKKEESLAE